MNIISSIIPPSAKGRRPGKPMKAKYITIHSTGNPKSTAKNEADNVCKNKPELKVSFHFAVDDRSIYQVLPTNEVAWHAGDGNGLGNTASIGIEICEPGDRKQSLINAIELTRRLMDQEGIPIENVVQHNYWSGKNCPRILRDKAFIRDGLDWKWFMTELKKAVTPSSAATSNKKEDNEVIEKGKFKVDGKVVIVDRILKDGRNFVELRSDIVSSKYDIGYDASNKIPVLTTKKK
jgi:N-acetylmuramoyl-L-alanine amidase